MLVHLKTLKNVISVYQPGSNDQAIASFISDIKKIVPQIEQLEDNYKEKLRNKQNFEMQQDEPFLKIQQKIEQIYTGLIS